MIVEKITNQSICNGLWYSKWHSVSRPTDEGSIYYQDLTVGEYVASILNAGNDTFIVVTYLTDIVDLSQYDYIDENPFFKIWRKSPGMMYMENRETGIRFNGHYEGLGDSEEGLNVYGSSCLFTTDLEEAYVESWFSLITIDRDGYNTYSEKYPEVNYVSNFLKMYEDYIRENYPERIISLKL